MDIWSMTYNNNMIAYVENIKGGQGSDLYVGILTLQNIDFDIQL